MEHDGPHVAISGVMFGEDEIVVQYIEGREASRAAYMARSLTIKIDYIQEEMDQLEELLGDIIDKGSILVRNPPKKVRRSTLGGGVEVLSDLIDDEEDDDLA